MRTTRITNHRYRAAVLVLSVLALVIFTAWITWLVTTAQYTAEKVEQALTPVTVAPALTIPTVDVEPVAVVQEVAPAVEDVAVSQRTASVIEDTPADEAPTLPFASEMAIAGIASIDQPIVLSLAMNEYGWNLGACGCQPSALRLPHDGPRFIYLNAYVKSHYGSWTAAQAQAAQGGW